MLSIRKTTSAGTATYVWDRDQTARSVASIVNSATEETIRSFSIKRDGEAVTWTDGCSFTCTATGPEDEMAILKRWAEGFAEIMDEESADSCADASLPHTTEEADVWDDLFDLPLEFREES
jgi:hypothetical protein